MKSTAPAAAASPGETVAFDASVPPSAHAVTTRRSADFLTLTKPRLNLLVLMTTLVLTLRAHRARFGDAYAASGAADTRLTAGAGHSGAAAGARA